MNAAEIDAHRRPLWAMLYRMTGCAADADDLVQETFARAIERPPDRLDAPIFPWLVRVGMNLARDLLRARRRRGYVGPWLPSPIETGAEQPLPSYEPTLPSGETAEWRFDLLESVSFAFLLALEALSPSQRAVLLLRDVFDYSVRETAEALDLSEANVKTIHLRARKKMETYRARRVAQPDAGMLAVLSDFLGKLGAGDVAGLEAMLAEDVRSLSDAGGEMHAALLPIVGPSKVTRLLVRLTARRPPSGVEMRTFNGTPALLISYEDDRPKEAKRLAFIIELGQDHKVRAIYSVLATRKLTAV